MRILFRNAEVGSSTSSAPLNTNPLTPVVSGLFSFGGGEHLWPAGRLSRFLSDENGLVSYSRCIAGKVSHSQRGHT